MKIRYILLLTANLLLTNTAFAEDGEILLVRNGCNNCHQPDKKTVGPSLKSIKEKFKNNYSNDPNAAWKLLKKVRAGGAGTWGSTAMPATPNSVSDEDIMAMIAAIVSPI
jgi:cytochrome c